MGPALAAQVGQDLIPVAVADREQFVFSIQGGVNESPAQAPALWRISTPTKTGLFSGIDIV